MKDSMLPNNSWSNNLDTLQWNNNLWQSASPSLLQSYEWGEFKQQFGWNVQRFANQTGIAQILFRPTPLGRIAYIPRGPVFTASNLSADNTAAFFSIVNQQCRKRNTILLKIEPEWLAGDEKESLLRSLGFQPSPQTVQPPSTVIIDLTGNEEAILARMKPKTRYNIRLSFRRQVSVESGSIEDVQSFSKILTTTASRDGFAVHPLEYYTTVYRIFMNQGLATLLLAKHEGNVIAGIMVFRCGDTAYYLYGASADESRNLMPTYALQWQAMLWARAHGCRRYDLWGIPDEVGKNPAQYMDCELPSRQGLWGVWRFKRGFGGEVVRYTGAWDYVYKSTAYLAYKLYLKLRRRANDA